MESHETFHPAISDVYSLFYMFHGTSTALKIKTIVYGIMALSSSLRVFNISVSWGASNWVLVQQVFSGLKDCSQSFSLNGFDSSSDFQLFHYGSQSFKDHSKRTSYNWYHHHPYVSRLSFSSGKVKITIILPLRVFHTVLTGVF